MQDGHGVLARRLEKLARARRSCAHPDVALPLEVAEALECPVAQDAGQQALEGHMQVSAQGVSPRAFVPSGI